MDWSWATNLTAFAELAHPHLALSCHRPSIPPSIHPSIHLLLFLPILQCIHPSLPSFNLSSLPFFESFSDIHLCPVQSRATIVMIIQSSHQSIIIPFASHLVKLHVHSHLILCDSSVHPSIHPSIHLIQTNQIHPKPTP